MPHLYSLSVQTKSANCIKGSKKMMGLGMGEIMVILVLALMVFGPRKLPELGKTLGQAMNQFRRASDEFKRTWEQEVEYDKLRTESKSTIASSGAESSSGYSADSDYQYGYDTGYDGVNGSSGDSTTTATTDATTTADTKAAAPQVENKAEPQWI
jgi:TatA/E family protein of Tat protein translocase